jgi:hypothetical protein
VTINPVTNPNPMYSPCHLAVIFTTHKKIISPLINRFNCARNLVIIQITNSVALVRKRALPTERPPLVGEVSANFLRVEDVAWSRQRIPTAVFSVF